MVVAHAHELDIRAFGEETVCTDLLAQLRKVFDGQLRTKEYRVRVAHVYRHKRHRPAVEIKELLRNDRVSHLDRYLLDYSFRNLQTQRTNAGQGLNSHRIARTDSAFVQVLRLATNGISAHLRFRAVGIEHPHIRVRFGVRQDEDQAVRTDTEMAVRDTARQGGQVRLSDQFGRSRLETV